AVPAAVLELLAEEAIDDAVDVHAVVGTEGHHLAVDARLDLALPERLARVLPAAVLPDEVHGPTDARGGRLPTEVLEQLQAVGGRRPRLARAVAAVRSSVADREQRAALPQAIVALEREHLRAPALGRHLRALGRDLAGRRVEQVLHRLPADGGV